MRIRRTNPQNIDKKYQAKFLCASARMNIFFLPGNPVLFNSEAIFSIYVNEALLFFHRLK